MVALMKFTRDICRLLGLGSGKRTRRFFFQRALKKKTSNKSPPQVGSDPQTVAKHALTRRGSRRRCGWSPCLRGKDEFVAVFSAEKRAQLECCCCCCCGRNNEKKFQSSTLVGTSQRCRGQQVVKTSTETRSHARQSRDSPL